MLKKAGSQFHINLMILFNAILKMGTWPFTENNIVRFLRKYGKDDYTKISSYRPITISSIVGKLMERILEARLRTISEAEHWIPESQHGFRKGRNTTTYLTEMLTRNQHQTGKKDNMAAFSSTFKRHLTVCGMMDSYTN